MATKNIELLILDKQFKQVAVVDYYSSLSWHKSMFGDGECEVQIPIADAYDLSYIQRNYYIARKDDNMVCVIQYTETTESSDGSDMLLVKATDITITILNKRIVYSNFIYSGSVTNMIYKLLTENFNTPAIAARAIKASDGTPLIRYDVVGTAGSELITYQSTNNAIGDLVKEILEAFRYGLQMTIQETDFVKHLVLTLYRPSNRSSYVIFDERFDNVVGTNFSSEFVRGSNVILVGGEDDGASRKYQSVGSMATGMDRNEEFLDQKSLSSNIDWKSLLTEYPCKYQICDFPVNPEYGGYTIHYQVTEDGKTYDRWLYRMGLFKIPIQDESQFTNLRNVYKDYIWYIDVDTASGITYFYIENCDIAVLTKDIVNDPPVQDEEGNYSNTPSCTALNVLYSAMLIQKGYEKYQEGTLDCSFSAEIDPNATFKYKQDYILADYVGIYNKYGIRAAVQITDVTETVDPTGYHLDVSLSNAQSKEKEDVLIYCGTDMVNTVYICTDDGDYICI